MNAFRLLALALVSLTFLAPAAPAAVPPDVTIEAFTFTPPIALTGDNRVIFKNIDPFAHEPHADNGCFGPVFITGSTTVTIDISNCPQTDIPYHCHIHEFMTGSIRRT